MHCLCQKNQSSCALKGFKGPISLRKVLKLSNPHTGDPLAVRGLTSQEVFILQIISQFERTSPADTLLAGLPIVCSIGYKPPQKSPLS